MFTDTHSHLYDEAFAGEEDLAVERAVDAGVTRMILPDIDASTREAMFSLADRHPDHLFPCIGLHPTSIGEGWKEELDQVLSYGFSRKVWAVGEIGLDCYWSKEFLKEQQEAFRMQLELAAKMSLPVIIHSRESTELILDILKDTRHLAIRGVMHAYSGSIETFREFQKLGDWYMGIGGVLTYKKASIAETVRQIPLERIVLETDSPYLTPVPFRGKRNESSYIPHIAGKLALQKETSIEEVAEVTTENARKLFGI
ncbi:MAG: TatD family hydrolase [Bacteroidales bacterium]|nr:TatD family hydrolase [Bacteroidales bacterium]